MAAPAPPGRLIIQFVPVQEAPVGTGVEGATLSACPLCWVRGVVGIFCIPCLELEGVEMGYCEECGMHGLLGHLCLAHLTLEYGQDYEAPMGNCPVCNQEGTCGTFCSACEDQCLVCD
jgi:hypothetical protein